MELLLFIGSAKPINRYYFNGVKWGKLTFFGKNGCLNNIILLIGSDALQNGQPGKGWDGRYKGVLMPQDVYIWEVKRAIFEDGTSWGGKRVGSVTLIR